ncbi:hypothetical protein V7S43_002092 [Phytophthora oleae]|uniref:Uncharacterized protein n=1 Tax=Phytophthora oleae TaxID=2107226 RepID=A0ABD3G3K5_9STRA
MFRLEKAAKELWLEKTERVLRLEMMDGAPGESYLELQATADERTASGDGTMSKMRAEILHLLRPVHERRALRSR